MTASLRTRPADTEYAPFYAAYVACVPAGDELDVLRADGAELAAAIGGIPEARGGDRYAAGKWSVREVVGHLIDAERIFTYRALRIARGDATPLASFDENAYVQTAGSDARSLADLTAELRAVRDATVRMFESFPDTAWTRLGVASGKEISVRALAYIIAGHARHHRTGLRERYGVA